MVEREFTSTEVAQRLGITRNTLMRYVNRSPELAPAKRLTPRLLMWTEAEIQRVIKHRSKESNPEE